MISSLKKALSRIPFLICLLVLAVAAGSLQPMAKLLGVRFMKKPIPLRKPLNELNKEELLPYRFRDFAVIESAILNTLGTDQYIQWILEDPTVKRADDPLRFATLFVTYYTGQPDQVPHVPEVCYLGAGYQLVDSKSLAWRIADLGLGDNEVPAQVLTFVKSNLLGKAETTVIYTFVVNGKFIVNRARIRLALADPTEETAYFSKVEVKFGWPGANPENPPSAQAVRAAERLMKTVLPILVRDHWPDMNKTVEDQAVASSRSGRSNAA